MEENIGFPLIFYVHMTCKAKRRLQKMQWTVIQYSFEQIVIKDAVNSGSQNFEQNVKDF